MNGRMYDPTVGRFLAPDNFVQMPDFSQSFNRYSYCLNNPLKYTDPSGESVIGFLTVAMMAYIGGLQANFGNVDGNPFNPGNWNWKSLRTYYGIISGAFSGGQMAGYQWAAWTSKLDVPGIITNGSIHAAGEVAFNGICNAIDKRGFFEGWQYSAMFGFIDGAYGGYTAANENGENFWWGGTVREGKSPWSLNPNGPVVVRFKNVHSFQSIGQNDCVPQTLAEDYRAIYGKSEKTPSYFADDLGYDPKSGTPFSDGTFKNYFSDDMIHTVNNIELIFNEAFVREAAKRNNAINIYWKAEKGDMDHLDVVRKVKFYKNRSKYYVRNYLFNSNNHSYRSINNIFGSFKPVVIYRIGK